ncbi:hypothetical protein [Kangiella koreensis]|uniref:Lipoprotein n=1 Tax=Kangiella koreensis (strain DSM 16069 / JCM 12317 / KCTC 12182 / SW-125) TaxID=523791 RepID=C7R983_KANKD|nr:hypothetical protein [Kangiella koreensis]ACV27873.1 hypothetical protein Kkor_2464 [Kangiella koreensis DSM 16069]
MNTCTKVHFCMMISGLILCVMSVSACAKHVRPAENYSEQVTAELCNEVNRYQDWVLYHDQWVSDTFDSERYQWKVGRGYPVKESKFYQKTDYDKYSTETLMRLAQDGDKAANLELAQRYYYFSSGNLNSAEHFCYMAVVDGLSAMTSCMISSYGAKVAKQMAKDQSAQSERQLELRLVLLGWIDITKDFDDIFAQRFAEVIKPGYQRNDITDAMIENAARDIRKKLKSDRQNRKQYKETLSANVEQKMPELWRLLEQKKFDENIINGCLNESQYATQ